MLWVALISICLVFLVLVLLVWVMKLFGYVFTRRQAAATAAANKSAVVPGQIHDEEIAAIATALKLYRSALHDRESEVLTILSIKRAYSPWNSKIHGLTPLPIVAFSLNPFRQWSKAFSKVVYLRLKHCGLT